MMEQNKERKPGNFLMVRTSNNVIAARDADSCMPDVVSPEGIAKVRTDPANPHWKDIPQQLRCRWLAQTIYTLMFTMKGKEDSEEQCAMTARLLDSEMVQDMYMQELTTPEILQAFRDGIFGKYGEFYGINPSSLHQFLWGYLQTPQKREAARLIRIQRGIEKDPNKDKEWIIQKYAESMARAQRERMEKDKKDNNKDK